MVHSIELPVIKRLHWLIAALFVLFAFQPIVAYGDQTVTAGDFVDSAGAPHPWHINAAHTLIWGGRPWIPAGGLFQSKYLTGSQNDTDWESDKAALGVLKAHGIHSIILIGASEIDPITNIPPANLQKVLNYLDDQGFQYGLQLSAFPRDPLAAYVANPSIYRVQAPEPGTTETFKNLTGLVSAEYYLVSQSDGSIIKSGAATVVDAGAASVDIPPDQGGTGTVLLVFPKRLFQPDSIEGRHMPDIWSNADDYRDSLMLYFNQIKFGPGFRFFLDPIVDEFGFYGDADAGAIPDSDAYRLQFQIWLQNKYSRSVAKLNEAWGIRNQDIFDFAAASRSLPLWYQNKGIQLLSDPVSSKTFEVLATRSGYWDDVRQFRSDCQRTLMNGIADTLKHGVADVPGVFRWVRPSRLYADQAGTEGYDGLLVTTGEHRELLATSACGWALSAEEQSARTEWLIAELQPASEAKDSTSTAKTAVTGDTSALQSIGVKGYFIDSLLKYDNGQMESGSLIGGPADRLDWIASDQATFDADTELYSNFKPNLLFYPLDLELTSTGIKQFGDGTWWLPSYTAGTEINIGRDLECYHLKQPLLGDSLVLWSPNGSTLSAQFQLPKNTPVRAFSPSGQIVTITLKKNVYTIPTSQTPVVIQGVSTLPLVANAPLLEMASATKLLELGKAEGVPLDSYSQRLYYIQNNVYDDGSSANAEESYSMLRALNSDLQNALSPYAWVEGEAASSQNLGTIVASPTASGGGFLWQDTDQPPPASAGQYSANYTMSVGAPSDYTLWAAIAPGPPGQGTTSPLAYSLDNGTAYTVSQPQAAGDVYTSILDAASYTRTGGFRWYNLGTINLTPGAHTLNILETGPAPSTGRYTLGIDAICLARAAFVPNGTQKPEIH